MTNPGDRGPSFGNPTGIFSHINEYRPKDVAHLFTLMAVSDPLTLWAPSAHLIERATTELGVAGPSGPDATTCLLRAIEDGHVRILARETWLMDAKGREAAGSRWVHAPWHGTFDAKLREWATPLANPPAGPPYVHVVEPERGYERADEVLAGKSRTVGQIAGWVRTGLKEPGRSPVPPGTLSRAARHEGNDFLMAREVIRDAANHARAMLQSGAQTEYFDPQWEKFQRHLGSELARIGGEPEFRAQPGSGALALGQRRIVVDRPLDAVIHVLESLRDDTSGQQLVRFLNGPEHHQLAVWAQGMAADLSDSGDPERLRALVATSLTALIDRDAPDRVLGWDTLIGAVGLAVAAAGYIPVLAGYPLLLALSLGLNAIGAGDLLMRLLSGVRSPLGYKGAYWPFYFAHGDRPTIPRIRRMLTKLREYEKDLAVPEGGG